MAAYINKRLRLTILIAVILAVALIVFMFFMKQPPEKTAKEKTAKKVAQQVIQKDRKALNIESVLEREAPDNYEFFMGGIERPPWEELLKKLEPLMVTLEDAQKRVPAKIALPTYLPAGTVLKGIIIFPAPPR